MDYVTPPFSYVNNSMSMRDSLFSIPATGELDWVSAFTWEKFIAPAMPFLFLYRNSDINYETI